MRIQITNITWKQRFQIERFLHHLSDGKDGYILFHKDDGFQPEIEIGVDSPVPGVQIPCDRFVPVDNVNGQSETIYVEEYGTTVFVNSE